MWTAGLSSITKGIYKFTHTHQKAYTQRAMILDWIGLQFLYKMLNIVYRKQLLLKFIKVALLETVFFLPLIH